MEDQTTLGELQKILKFSLESRRSDFYRKKYVGHKLPKVIKKFEDFQKIPFLEKQELLDVSPNRRLFLPFRQVTAIEPTSGTTDKPLLMFTGPFSKKQRQVYEKYFKKLKIKKLLILLSPIQAYHRAQALGIKGVTMFIGDVRNLALTAQIASQVKIQAIRTTSTILADFLTPLSKVYDLNKITYVVLSGEFCTSQRAQSLKEKLPRAKIYFSYGSAETLIRAYQCDFLARENPQYFHPFPDFYFEIVDPRTGKNLKNGEEGEIVLTTLAPTTHPTPLLRYHTGDLGILSKRRCPCGKRYLLEVGGRASYDSLKIGGVMIHAQKIQDAVSKFSHLLKPDFQLHVYEKKLGSKIVVSLELELMLKDDKKPQTLSFLEQEISKNLYLTPNLTLAEFVKQGIFLPLEIKPVASLNLGVGKKKKYIIPHLSE